MDSTLDPSEVNLDLADKIDRLSEDKQHVIREDAIEAKRHYDSLKGGGSQIQQSVEDAVRHQVTHERCSDPDGSLFSDHVNLLVSVFKASRFDEFMVLISHPQRLFAMHFLSGFFKGMGIVFGMGLMILIGVLLAKDIVVQIIGILK